MNEQFLPIPGPEGPIPALAIRENPAESLSAVILCHGLGGAKETNRPELERLARAGFLAVGLDAPSHGDRKDARLAAMNGLSHSERYAAFMDLVRRAAHEIPAVVQYLLERRASSVGLIGISMGGFTGFAACLQAIRPSAVACTMASPDFRYRVGDDHVPAPGYDDSPHYFPQRFPPTAVRIITAGRDTTVPPAAARRFVDSLRPYYAAFPDRLSARDFPESEHMMRPEDWDAAWDETLTWLFENLTTKS